jgi:hypothetical protein
MHKLALCVYVFDCRLPGRFGDHFADGGAARLLALHAAFELGAFMVVFILMALQLNPT